MIFDNISTLFFLIKDENPEESWMLIPENDLIALFLQFPFDGLYEQIFGTSHCDGNIL